MTSPDHRSVSVEPTLAQDLSALALLAFGTVTRQSQILASDRNLAMLPSDALYLDLEDPEQRDFGDYELLKVLGQGGMGVVYLARQHSLDREVALKLIAAGPWSSREFIDRFRREAQYAARLQHPNIVPIFEIGSREELNFFTMQVVHGPTVAQALKKKGPLPPTEAARLVRTIAEAVDYAHRMDVLHLDLKPSNVLLDHRDEPMVADFGLAQRLDQSLERNTSEILGTPSYMAPEQADPTRGNLSPLTDIFGLGTILYELLCGTPPFRESSTSATLDRVRDSVPAVPLKKRVPKVPPDLDAICLKCLAKPPGDRYQTARELAEDLTRFLESRPVSVRPLALHQKIVRAARREPFAAAAAGAAALALLLGLAATSVQWQRAESSAHQSQALLWESRRSAALRLANDGRGFEAAKVLVRNIVEQQGAKRLQEETTDRRAIGLLLNTAPTLIDAMQVSNGQPVSVALSEDGRTLALGMDDLMIRWYRTHNLSEQGSVDLGEVLDFDDYNRKPALIKFVDDDKLLVTLDWLPYFISPTGTDMYLIDLANEEVIEPPSGFGAVASATYSSDGGHALLRSPDYRMQVWQTPVLGSQWHPVSDVAAAAPFDRIPWLLGRNAEFILQMDPGMTPRTFFPDPRNLHREEAPAFTKGGYTAWAQANHSSSVALGDMEGRIWLLEGNPDQPRVRQLPTPHGDRIQWITFSEDDDWLAAANRDGNVYAFNLIADRYMVNIRGSSTFSNTVTSLVGGQVAHEFEPQRVSISQRHRLMLVSGQGKTALWRLPEPSMYPREAIRVSSSPTSSPLLSGRFAVDWSINSGLLAGAGSDGVIRLWRLPTSPILPGRAARQIAHGLGFDGKAVPEVSGRSVRLLDALSRTPAGPWATLPQEPGFSELTSDGRTLVVSTGPELHIFDAASMKLRFPPIKLVSSPLRMAIHPGAESVIVSYAHNRTGTMKETVLGVSLATGQVLGSLPDIPGPLRRMDFSPNGKRLLIFGTNPQRLVLVSTPSMKITASFEPDPGNRIAAAAVNGDKLVMAQFDTQATRPDELIYWDISSAERISRAVIADTEPHALGAIGTGYLILGAEADYLLDQSGQFITLPRNSRERAVPAFAVSHDQSLIARATRGAVLLYDTNGLPLGEPLAAEISGHDAIAELAFSPEGKQLLARSALGRWLTWTIEPDQRKLAELAQQLDLTEATSLTKHNRMVLRQSDPGPWKDFSKEERRLSARDDVPRKSQVNGVDLHMLDLSSHFNLGVDDLAHELIGLVMDISGLPLGKQRIDGVDYALEGGILFQTPLSYYAKRAGLNTEAIGIAVPPVPIDGFHVLLYAYLIEPEPTKRKYMSLQLHYLDGSTSMVDLYTQQDVPGWTERDQPAPIGWTLTTAGTYVWDGFQEPLSNPYVKNPHPEKLIQSIDIVAAEDAPGAPTIFAVTARQTRGSSDELAAPLVKNSAGAAM